MFCHKCGNKLSEESEFCHKCGAKIARDGAMETSESMPITEDIQEDIIMEGLCNRVKSESYVQNGTGTLTDKRFIYQERGFSKKMQGAIRAVRPIMDISGEYGTAKSFLNDVNNLSDEDMAFAINLSDIASIEDGKQGVSKTIIINTKSGRSFNFYVTKREQWKIAIQNAVNAAQSISAPKPIERLTPPPVTPVLMTTAPTVGKSEAVIQSYTAEGTISMDIKVTCNGQYAGTVKKNESITVSIPTDSTLEFKCGPRTTSIMVKAGKRSELRLEFDKGTGKLHVFDLSSGESIEQFEKMNKRNKKWLWFPAACAVLFIIFSLIRFFTWGGGDGTEQQREVAPTRQPRTEATATPSPDRPARDTTPMEPEIGMSNPSLNQGDWAQVDNGWLAISIPESWDVEWDHYTRGMPFTVYNDDRSIILYGFQIKA